MKGGGPGIGQPGGVLSTYPPGQDQWDEDEVDLPGLQGRGPAAGMKVKGVEVDR